MISRKEEEAAELLAKMVLATNEAYTKTCREEDTTRLAYPVGLLAARRRTSVSKAAAKLGLPEDGPIAELTRLVFHPGFIAEGDKAQEGDHSQWPELLRWAARVNARLSESV